MQKNSKKGKTTLRQAQGKKKKPVVFVGLSGGVDSSVSAALLKEQGYVVVGVFIRTWAPDFIKCPWRAERRDAMRVSAHLDIPFLECDLQKEYKEGVADYMINEYRKGRTPNPDVACNREIKFGAFWQWAKAQGAQFIATGHYARNVKHEAHNAERYELHAARYADKDQSYFLWTLRQDDLAHVLFPVGNLKKTEVRKLAKKFDLPTAEKKDSQGICMLGPLDVREFLSHYIEPKKGNILDEDGKIIGHHTGAVFLTLGERHGFTITQKTAHDAPYYIVAKDIKKNTITVSHLANKQDSASHLKTEIKIEDCNWISGMSETDKIYTAQIRYHGEQLPCEVSELKNKTAIVVTFKIPQLVSSGQSIVLYDKDTCLGGGIVQRQI